MEALTREEDMMMELPVSAKELDGVRRIYGNLISDKTNISGYEAISFRKEAMFALEVVLSSIVSFNDELVVLGEASGNKSIADICDKHQLSYLDFSKQQIENQIENLASLLQINKHVSSVLLVLSSDISETIISVIADICSVYKVDLLIFTKGVCKLNVTNLLGWGVNFLVSSPNLQEHNSIVIARRSSLVKTEGISRYFRYDLYSYWQRSIRSRNSHIQPLVI